MPAAKIQLPPGVRCGHVEGEFQPPAGFSLVCRLGQLVDVRDGKGNFYLLGQTDTHWTLHRRLTPDAHGHARNLTDPEPTHRLAKHG